LLAAGLGSRLRPLTNKIPKCLVEINGKPLLEYWLDQLADANIGPVLINLHHLSEQVISLVETRGDRSNIYTVFEPELLGTGGTLRANANFCLGERVMVIHADNLCLSDLTAFTRAHQQRPLDTEITMMTFVSDSPWDCGVVEINEHNIVTSFHEKSISAPSNVANAAVYIFEPTVFEYVCMQSKGSLDISTEILPHYVGRMFAWKADGFHIDVGTQTNLDKAIQYICTRC